MQVEQLRDWLTGHRGARDATLVSVLAYAGLRPQEALALRWGNVRERTLLVEEAVAYGARRPAGHRGSCGSWRPSGKDRAEWQLVAGVPDGDAFVFPSATGEPWPLHDWQNWRRCSFTAAARAVGLADVVPYDLRHHSRPCSSPRGGSPWSTSPPSSGTPRP